MGFAAKPSSQVKSPEWTSGAIWNTKDFPNPLADLVKHHLCRWKLSMPFLVLETRWAQNDSKSLAIASLVAILDQVLFLEDWVWIYNASDDVFLVLPRGPSEVGSKRDSRPFVWYQTRVGFFVFLDITALFFQPLFVPIPLIRNSVFFCLHSFSAVSVKMCLFYFHRINSGLNFDRMFLVFWERSVRHEGSLKLTV